jgi:ABC-type nitrate/sulfonate/bicarbonate transport system permease component
MMYLVWCGFVVACFIGLIVGFAVMLTDVNNQPCSTYVNWSVKDVPVRCVKELTK